MTRLAILVCLLLSLWEFSHFWAERLWIGNLAGILPGDVDELSAVLDARLNQPRIPEPFLRWSALRTWTERKGDCASGARIAILVLHAKGIHAQRLILGRHTGIAYRTGGVWKGAPGVRAPPAWKRVLQGHPVLSSDNLVFENYSLWNWHRLGLKLDQHWPWPFWMIPVLESPNAIKGVLWLLLAGAIHALRHLVARIPGNLSWRSHVSRRVAGRCRHV